MQFDFLNPAQTMLTQHEKTTAHNQQEEADQPTRVPSHPGRQHGHRWFPRLPDTTLQGVSDELQMIAHLQRWVKADG